MHNPAMENNPNITKRKINIPWLFNMALRDSRKNRSRLLLFISAIIFGIAALVAIYSFRYNLQNDINEQAATLIGADLVVSGGKPVDASGALPDGTRLNGPAGLQRFFVAQREQFVTTLTEKLLTYALGRKLDSSDGPAVREVRRAAAAHQYRWSSIVLGIVKSTPFQMRSTGS